MAAAGLFAVGAVGLVGSVGLVGAGCGSGAGRPSTGLGSRTTVMAPATLPAALPAALPTLPSTTTTTTVDPGSLPQTTALPSGDDPSFRSRIEALWSAIVDGNPSEGLVAFFPLSAYVQVKGISDPAHDYQTRLIANYWQDIQSLHLSVVSAAGVSSLLSVQVPPAAQWIRPGVEYNKGSYWRVYGTTVTYLAGGQRRTFEIHSLISWRGEWYVVHLGAIR